MARDPVKKPITAPTVAQALGRGKEKAAMHWKLILLTILMTLTLTGHLALAAQHAASVKLESHRQHVEQVLSGLRRPEQRRPV
jgi:hypothetical protein